MVEAPDVFENRVRFSETDMQGVVFYGNYLVYQDETFNAFLRELETDYWELHDAGWEPHVVSVDVDFRSAARFGDVLVNSMRAARIGGSSLDLDWAVRRKDDDELVADGSVTYVVVDDTGDPVRVPETFREAIRAFQDDPPIEE